MCKLKRRYQIICTINSFRFPSLIILQYKKTHFINIHIIYTRMEWVGGGPLLHDREKIIKQLVQVTLTTNQRLDVSENNDIQTLVSFINIIIYEYY